MSLSLSLANVGRALAYYPKLSKFFGSINSSIFFTQLHYWQSRNDDERGVFKSSEEWTEETGLSYREQATARKHLAKLGFLKETHKRLQHRIYFKLDLEAVDAAFEAWTKAQFPNDENAIGEMRQTQFADSAKRSSPCDKNAVRGATKAQLDNKDRLLKEITAKTTAENYSPPRRERREGDPVDGVVTTAEPVNPPAPSAAPEPQAAMVITAPNGTVYEIPGELRYPGDGAKTHKAWIAYALAYQRRYHSWPIWNATVAGQMARLVDRLGVDRAPRVAVHYVRRVNEEFIVKQMHPVKLLLADAEKWATQCETGQSMTSTRAQQIDQTQSNFDAAGEAVAILRANRAQQQGGPTP